MSEPTLHHTQRKKKEAFRGRAARKKERLTFQTKPQEILLSRFSEANLTFQR